jgi:hypothetical protein
MQNLNELFTGLSDLEVLVIRTAVFVGVVITCLLILGKQIKQALNDFKNPKPKPPKRRRRNRRHGV